MSEGFFATVSTAVSCLARFDTNPECLSLTIYTAVGVLTLVACTIFVTIRMLKAAENVINEDVDATQEETAKEELSEQPNDPVKKKLTPNTASRKSAVLRRVQRAKNPSPEKMAEVVKVTPKRAPRASSPSFSEIRGRGSTTRKVVTEADKKAFEMSPKSVGSPKKENIGIQNVVSGSRRRTAPTPMVVEDFLEVKAASPKRAIPAKKAASPAKKAVAKAVTAAPKAATAAPKADDFEAAIRNMSVPELRTELKGMELNCFGTKEDLATRLIDGKRKGEEGVPSSPAKKAKKSK